MILIIGWPGSGKTTLAKKFAAKYGLEHLSTDPQRFCFSGERGIPDELDWSGGSQWVSDHYLGKPIKAVLEGCALPRSLRKWMKANPGKPVPCERLIHLTANHLGAMKQGQISQGKGIDSVLAELWPWMARKVERVAQLDEL